MEQTTKPKFTRRKYFIRKDIQGRYLVMITVASVVPAFIVSLCLYYLMGQMMAEELAFPDAIAAHVIPVWKTIGLIMLIGLPIVFVGIFFWGLMLSHTFAGPVHKLEETMLKIADGDYSLRIKFRKRDRLDTLANSINSVLDQLEKSKRGS